MTHHQDDRQQSPSRQTRRTRHVPAGRRRAGRSGLVLALGAVLAASGCRLERVGGDAGTNGDEPDLRAQVATMLDTQARAWNAGDLDGFMSAYSPSSTTTFIGSTGLLEGFEAIRERYAPGFAPGATRDSLRFESVRAREIEARVGVATARYVLHRDGEVVSTGPFTLVLLNVEGAWLIVHDQSTEDPPATDAAVAGSPDG